MSQDKEYIPEWHKPHIGSEAKSQFIIIEYDGVTIINKSLIQTIDFNGSNKGSIKIFITNSKNHYTFIGNDEDLNELYQSILDQLNQ